MLIEMRGTRESAYLGHRDDVHPIDRHGDQGRHLDGVSIDSAELQLLARIRAKDYRQYYW